MLVRSDEKGIYIKHGNDKVRPEPSPQFEHLGGEENGYRETLARHMKVSIPASSTRSMAKAGDRVKKYHPGQTTMVRVVTEQGITELWFIGEEPGPLVDSGSSTDQADSPLPLPAVQKVIRITK